MLLALTALRSVWADDGRQRPPAHGADAALRRTFDAIARNRLGEALTEADRLIAAHPNFRLAHLVRGDILLARAGTVAAFGNGKLVPPERIGDLRAEALARLRAYRERPPAGSVPRALIQLALGQKHVLLVDASRWRLYVYENTPDGPRLVADYYTTLGKRGIEKLREGDQKTPIGVYAVTSSIPGSKLPDLYGWGALPISYPNEWDRLRGRTGHGIWLHGVPADTYARAPWASDGCIALANPDMEELARRVEIGATPVIIAERLEWVAPEIVQSERAAFMRELEAWRASWESRDSARYLAHYARGFRSDSMNLEAWSAHKRSVNAGKLWIKIGLSGVSVFRSSGKDDLMVVTFEQDYRSNNLSQKARKRQYWIQESGRWKIAYEAPVGRPVVAMPESFRGASR